MGIGEEGEGKGIDEKGGLEGCALEKRERGRRRKARSENTTNQKPPLSDLFTTAKEKQDSLPLLPLKTFH